MASQQPQEKYFTVTLKRSAAGAHKTHKATLAGLGLKRMGQVVSRKDIPSVRGMLYKVSHLVQIAPATEVKMSARAKARAYAASQAAGKATAGKKVVPKAGAAAK